MIQALATLLAALPALLVAAAAIGFHFTTTNPFNPLQLQNPATWTAQVWNIAADKFPGATCIVDLFHAREHLHSLARSLEFMLLDHYGEWLAARLEDLDYGYIDGIDTPGSTGGVAQNHNTPAGALPALPFNTNFDVIASRFHIPG